MSFTYLSKFKLDINFLQIKTNSISLKNNKSKLLIFTAGQLPWTKNWRPEGGILKDKAIEFGIDKNKILVSAKVKNTYEESLKTLQLIVYWFLIIVN
jgi:hypothetical protein